MVVGKDTLVGTYKEDVIRAGVDLKSVHLLLESEESIELDKLILPPFDWIFVEILYPFEENDYSFFHKQKFVYSQDTIFYIPKVDGGYYLKFWLICSINSGLAV